MRAVLENPGIIGFCWTQLTDTLQETNGLLTEQREQKVDPAVIRGIFNQPAASNPTEHVAASRKAARWAARSDPEEPAGTDSDTPGIG